MRARNYRRRECAYERERDRRIRKGLTASRVIKRDRERGRRRVAKSKSRRVKGIFRGIDYHASREGNEINEIIVECMR